MTWLRRIDGWWMQPLDARPLAFFRVALGLFAVFYLIAQWSNLTSSASFTSAQFAPVGVATVLGAPLSGWMVYALMTAAIASGFGFALGWRFRLTGPLFALLLLWVLTYRNSWGQIYHVENLMLLHVIVLAFTRSADDLALDAREGRSSQPNRLDYGWPLRLCAVLTVTTYVIAGWAKLDISGLAWVTSDALRNHVAFDNLRYEILGDYDSPLGIWMVGHGWIFKPLAVATLILELGAPFALLGRRVALVWAIAAWLFHLGILGTMLILFFYPLAGLAFLPLFAWDGAPIVKRVQRLAEIWQARATTGKRVPQP